MSQVPEAGVSQTAFEQGNTALFETSGPTSGPDGLEPDLMTIVEAWEFLTENDRRKIGRIVTKAIQQR